MEKIIDLRDLLKHEIVDLYSVESQIIDALPDMIDKAINPSLKKALNNHLSVTEEQRKRLDKIKGLIIDESNEQDKESPGFFARIFGGSGEEKCRGMEGILDEGRKMIGMDMSPEVLDAAIIAACQKVEHYEICGYGTALAYARELRLQEVSDHLAKSLDEEYEADDNLTFLAVGHLNLEAEFAGGDMGDDAPLKQKKSSAANNKGRERGDRVNVNMLSEKTSRSSGKGSKKVSELKKAPTKSEAPKKTGTPVKSSTNGKMNQPGKSEQAGSRNMKSFTGNKKSSSKNSSAPKKATSKSVKSNANSASKGKIKNAVKVSKGGNKMQVKSNSSALKKSAPTSARKSSQKTTGMKSSGSRKRK